MAQAAEALTKTEPPKGGLLDLLEKSRGSIAAALPRHITAERMMRVARTAIQTTPGLQKCAPMTVLGAIVEASQLGLEPNGVLGEGYLIPFKNKRTGRVECQFIPGYRGYISLARRSGLVLDIDAQMVCANDRFEFAYGLEPKLIHVPVLTGRGNAIAFYAVCRFKDGSHHFVVMSDEEVEAIRQASPGRNSDAWQNHRPEMGKKTTIRRLAKYLPLSPEFQRAAMLDEYADAGYRPGPGDVIDVTAVQTAHLRDRLEAAVIPAETTAVDTDTGEVIQDPREEAAEAPESADEDLPDLDAMSQRLVFQGKRGNFQKQIEALIPAALQGGDSTVVEVHAVICAELDGLGADTVNDVPPEVRGEFVAKLKRELGV